VRLATDIVQLLGTSSVPVVVAGSVLGVFELGERLASQRAKDARRSGLRLRIVNRWAIRIPPAVSGMRGGVHGSVG
jgi:hypothetical protein